MKSLEKAVQKLFGAKETKIVNNGVYFSYNSENYLLVPMEDKPQISLHQQAVLYKMRDLSYVLRGVKYNTEIPSSFSDIYEIFRDIEGKCTLSRANVEYVYNEENIKFG